MTAVDEPILYVNPDTMSRLLASGRAAAISVNGVATTAFAETDPKYPKVKLLVSREVTGHAVHRKVWVAADQRFVFEYVGDV
jgi:hypothetical protein